MTHSCPWGGLNALQYSGAAWNEFNNYQYKTFPSQLMNYICSPSTGACYFFLFLVCLLVSVLVLFFSVQC